jgi:hypothetical protein
VFFEVEERPREIRMIDLKLELAKVRQQYDPTEISHKSDRLQVEGRRGSSKIKASRGVVTFAI